MAIDWGGIGDNLKIYDCRKKSNKTAIIDTLKRKTPASNGK